MIASAVIEPVSNPDQLRVLARMLAEGESEKAICKALRLSRATFYRKKRELKRLEAKHRPQET